MVIRLSHLPASWWKTLVRMEVGSSFSMEEPREEICCTTPFTAWLALKLILASMPLSRHVMPAWPAKSASESSVSGECTIREGNVIVYSSLYRSSWTTAPPSRQIWTLLLPRSRPFVRAQGRRAMVMVLLTTPFWCDSAAACVWEEKVQISCRCRRRLPPGHVPSSLRAMWWKPKVGMGTSVTWSLVRRMSQQKEKSRRHTISMRSTGSSALSASTSSCEWRR
mmetsp:Transcript_6086/g.12814  ORF Transcript_6086/g.12814 Transcript_6086/m.12814 type:complete len:223 (+) Transcript_6086:653-1321(+)